MQSCINPHKHIELSVIKSSVIFLIVCNNLIIQVEITWWLVYCIFEYIIVKVLVLSKYFENHIYQFCVQRNISSSSLALAISNETFTTYSVRGGKLFTSLVDYKSKEALALLMKHLPYSSVLNICHLIRKKYSYL